MAHPTPSPVQPFYAAHYGREQRAQIDQLVVRDLDSAQNIWGGTDRTHAFRNVLVGATSQRSEIWQSWLGAGIIDCPDRPAFFVLRQIFFSAGIRVDRWAFFATLAVDDRDIIIHEDVVAEGVERARQATEACEGDLAPIFIGYDESMAPRVREFLRESVQGLTPLMTFHERENPSHEHVVWELRDSKKIIQAQDIFRDEKLYVLDGHHRLAAAKANLRQGLGDGKILACICSLSGEDTLIQPIHRVVHYGAWMLNERLVEDLVGAGCQVKDLMAVQPNQIEQQLAQLSTHPLSCFVLHAHSNRILQLQFSQRTEQIPMEMRDMAVAHLEYYLDKFFPKANVIPVSDAKLALEQLALEQAHVGFFLPALNPQQVKRVARSGLRLPRKSTRFVPKPALGLIMRPWR